MSKEFKTLKNLLKIYIENLAKKSSSSVDDIVYICNECRISVLSRQLIHIVKRGIEINDELIKSLLCLRYDFELDSYSEILSYIDKYSNKLFSQSIKRIK